MQTSERHWQHPVCMRKEKTGGEWKRQIPQQLLAVWGGCWQGIGDIQLKFIPIPALLQLRVIVCSVCVGEQPWAVLVPSRDRAVGRESHPPSPLLIKIGCSFSCWQFERPPNWETHVQAAGKEILEFSKSESSCFI